MLAVSPKTGLISSLPVALAISAEEASQWRKRLKPSRYGKGQILFYRGHLPYGVYILHAGKVELRVSESDGHAPLRAGPATILGLATFVANQPYALTAVVTEELLASFAEKTVLQEWIRSADRLLPREISEYLPPRSGRARRKKKCA